MRRPHTSKPQFQVVDVPQTLVNCTRRCKVFIQTHNFEVILIFIAYQHKGGRGVYEKMSSCGKAIKSRADQSTKVLICTARRCGLRKDRVCSTYSRDGKLVMVCTALGCTLLNKIVFANVHLYRSAGVANILTRIREITQ